MTGRPRSKVRSATSRVKDFSGRWTAPGRCSWSYSSRGRTSTSWAPAATRRCTPPRTTGLGATGSAFRPVVAGHGAAGPMAVPPQPGGEGDQPGQAQQPAAQPEPGDGDARLDAQQHRQAAAQRQAQGGQADEL